MTGKISAAVREIIDRVYPVGIILDFATEVDPNAAIGCGSVWTRMADGRTLIASDASHPVGWTGGTEEVTLTVEQMPYHEHGQYLYFTSGESSNVYAYQALNSHNPDGIRAFSGNTGGNGGNQPHNNTQPSMAVSRWKRVA